MIGNELVLKFLKFGIVGASGLGVDFGFTYIFKEKINLNRYLANAIGFLLAASSNYFLNRIWTFHSEDPNIATQYFSFLIVSIIGLGINTLFLYFFEMKLKFNFYIAKVFAIGITTLWNFIANYMITFA